MGNLLSATAETMLWVYNGFSAMAEMDLALAFLVLAIADKQKATSFLISAMAEMVLTMAESEDSEEI